MAGGMSLSLFRERLSCVRVSTSHTERGKEERVFELRSREVRRSIEMLGISLILLLLISSVVSEESWLRDSGKRENWFAERLRVLSVVW
jgi:hypothetical protein